MEWSPALRSKSTSCSAQKRSKPAIQAPTPSPRTMEASGAPPVSAMATPIGASICATPSQRWHAQVKRFAKL